MILSNFAIKNRATVIMVIVLIIVAGLTSYFSLPREAFPEVKIPYIMVTTVYEEGSSPEEIEKYVTIKLENKLTNLKGVKEVSSTSSDDMSRITVEFLPNVDIDDALQRVRDKVELAKGDDFPDGAAEPIITEISTSDFPVIMIAMTGDLSPVRMKYMADRLEDTIEAIPGVLNCDVLGVKEREIRLEVDPDRLAAYGLTIADLVNLIPSENINTSAGGLETGKMNPSIRVPAEIRDPSEVANFLLTIQNGKPIYLQDVATVRDTFKDPTSLSRLNGQRSITISVQKRLGADMLKISRYVEAVVKEFERQAPKGVELQVTSDLADNIRMMVEDLENNIISGLILVALVLFFFMGSRMSFIVAMAIPMSMLMSFAILSTLGFTLNMVVLFSLILALGMLVDNAIVIVENIYRHMQLGEDRIHAAMHGTAEVAWPVIASTATTIAAFCPMLFWPGIMGDFMKYLPTTLIITLSSSLFVALVINPVICSVVGARAKKKEKRHWFLKGYRKLLTGAIRRWWLTLPLVLVIFFGTTQAYKRFNHGTEFFSKTDPKNALINIRCPQGTSIYRTDSIARELERRLDPFSDDLVFLSANVGSGGEGFMTQGSSGPHIGNLTMTFQDFVDRPRPAMEAIREIRPLLNDIPGAEIKLEEEQRGPATGDPVEIRIIGEDFDRLEELSEQVKEIVAQVPGVVHLRSSHEKIRPELSFNPDRRRAMITGTNTRSIGTFMQTAIFGRKVGTYRHYNDEFDITIRLPLTERSQLEDIFRLRVPNVIGKGIPLDSVTDLEFGAGFGNISRVNRHRVITLSAGAAGGTGQAEQRVRHAVKTRLDEAMRNGEIDLTGGYRVEHAGQAEEQEENKRFLSKAFVVALLLIVIILVLQFNTFTAPLIIMITVALSLVGVLVGLMVTGMPMSIVLTGIGIISLAGIVVNNAIVLLDCTRQLQRDGMDVIDAAVEAGTIRLRPVLLTATTTIFGLIPMATGVTYDFHTMKLVTESESSQFWAPMAVAVIFGLAFATLLTLVVIPTLYACVFRIVRFFGFGGLKHIDISEPDLQAEA